MSDLGPRPVFTRTISFGNVVQIAILLVGIGSAWATMRGELSDMGDDVGREARRIDAEIENRQIVEGRVRALEIEVARADERYSQLVAMIAAIRDSIVRLENAQK